MRELSFRQVQEGTGNALDIDGYDRYYRHLILWDEDELEIIGSYRIGEAAEISKHTGQMVYICTVCSSSVIIFALFASIDQAGARFIQPGIKINAVWITCGMALALICTGIREYVI